MENNNIENNSSNLKKSTIKEFVDLYFTRRMLAIFLMGYASGFPHVLMGSFAFWMAQSDVSLRDIGLFGLTGTPFLLKFLWSPLVDGIKMPFFSKLFGQKKGWLIFMQVIITSLIVFWAGLDPKEDLMLCVYLAIIISFASATSDIAIDALRVELLERREQGAGATVSVMGYRIAVLVASGLVMIVAGVYSWQIAFYVAAATMAFGVIGALLAKEPEFPEKFIEGKLSADKVKKWFKSFVVAPFSNFMTNRNWGIILAFIVLYKIGDAYLGAMANPFYQKTGFTPEQIGAIAKTYGMAVSIIAGIIGGYLIYKIGIFKSLLIFGIFQAATNLAFAWLANVGADLSALTITISIDNASGALATSAFVAYLSSLCNLKFTATQYALLSSFASVGRTWLSSVSGYIVDAENGFGMAWDNFFILTTIMGLPALFLIKYIKTSANKS